MHTFIAIFSSFLSLSVFAVDSFSELGHWSLHIQRNLSLPAKSQAISVKPDVCSLRSLESYQQDETIVANTQYDLVLKNYNPLARTWVFILRSFKEKVKYLTITCPDSAFEMPVQKIEDAFADFGSLENLEKASPSDWIENFSNALFWRPSLSKATKVNRYRSDVKVATLVTARNHRSVLKFKKSLKPVASHAKLAPTPTGCLISTLYSSQEKGNFREVGEYKIVNLDYNPELKYLLIVGRNFFKQPMYAIIHCHGVDKSFSVGELERELSGALTVHKISIPHW